MRFRRPALLLAFVADVALAAAPPAPSDAELDADGGRTCSALLEIVSRAVDEAAAIPLDAAPALAFNAIGGDPPVGSSCGPLTELVDALDGKPAAGESRIVLGGLSTDDSLGGMTPPTRVALRIEDAGGPGGSGYYARVSVAASLQGSVAGACFVTGVYAFRFVRDRDLYPRWEPLQQGRLVVWTTLDLPLARLEQVRLLLPIAYRLDRESRDPRSRARLVVDRAYTALLAGRIALSYRCAEKARPPFPGGDPAVDAYLAFAGGRACPREGAARLAPKPASACQAISACPDEDRFRFDPEVWRRQVAAAGDDPVSLDRELARAGFEPERIRGGAHACRILAADVFPATLGVRSRADRILQVRTAGCALERDVVIHTASPGGAWCRVKGSLDLGQSANGCGFDPPVLRLLNLTDPKRDTLRVDGSIGQNATADDGGKTCYRTGYVNFYDVEAGALVHRLYVPAGPIELVGGFPREVRALDDVGARRAYRLEGAAYSPKP